MGLPSLLPRTPRSALITPRSARGTPRSTTTTPRDPRDDPATQLRRSLKASRSSAAVLSGDTGERGDGSGTIRPRAQSAGATHLGALADLRPPPNRRGVLGGGSVGDGAPGGGGGAYDMNLTPRSPRELSPDGSRASTARSRNRVGSAGSVVGGDTIFPDAVEVTQVDADELELNLEDTGRGRAGSDLADDAIGPHASFRRRSDSAVDAPANEVARRTRPSTVGHKAVRPPLGKPLRRVCMTTTFTFAKILACRSGVVASLNRFVDLVLGVFPSRVGPAAILTWFGLQANCLCLISMTLISCHRSRCGPRHSTPR